MRKAGWRASALNGNTATISGSTGGRLKQIGRKIKNRLPGIVCHRKETLGLGVDRLSDIANPEKAVIIIRKTLRVLA